MRHIIHRRIRTLIPLPALFALFWAAGLAGTSAAESKPIRLAIGPFFAPVGNEGLRQASQAMPDLLMTELSRQSRFHLVERDKVESIWSEMKLTSSGLVARDTVAKLGHVLACDWLVSGSFVQAGGKTNVWTKVIDIRTGVVLDLNNSPLEDGDYTKAIAGIAAFLAKAGSEPKGRQFITMGQFVDMNPPSAPKREDWSRRTAVLIERHFHHAGYGVVEMAAVGPIFEERRLESAGLTGNPNGRVKLQPAFWLVDGGWGWLEGEPQKVGVALRVQQIGGPEQIIRLTNSPGELMENDVIRALTEALARTNLLAQSNPNAEADLLNVRGQEMAERRVAFQPFGTNSSDAKIVTQWEGYKQAQERRKQSVENRHALLANYERLLLRDPNNQRAKWMLAYGWIGDSDPARKQRGLEMMREVEANKDDPESAAKAHHTLTNAPLLKQMQASGSGPHVPRRPNDWLSLNQAYQENPNDPEIKCDLANALINLPRATDRERGRSMLNEVAACDNPGQAERARKLLAQPELTSAIRDVPKPPSVAAAIPEPEPEEDSATRARREFLQKNFDKFIPAKFQIDGPQVALLQSLPVQKNMFEYNGGYYCGFRFKMPPVIDGNLKWMDILAKTEGEKDFIALNSLCGIIPKNGTMDGTITYSASHVNGYKKLRERFPHTKKFFSYELPHRYLKPGQEYAIWFSFEEKNHPDIAFALAMASYDGYKRYGILPMQ